MKLSPILLEERLIKYGVSIIQILDTLKNHVDARNISNQISRSCMSPALNYAEAQVAESKRDFIHKMKIVLKELKETLVALRFIQELNYSNNPSQIEKLLKEGRELTSIFVASIKTAKGIK